MAHTKCLNHNDSGSDDLDCGSSSSAPTPPRYYCVIDFEATCMKDRRITNQEVIEFPAVIINADTLLIELEFHSYVKPITNPILDSFCTSLTGIEQDTVDRAKPFQSVFYSFQQFMLENGFDLEGNWEGVNALADGISCPVSERKAVTFITHGAWDLRTMLPAQCRLSHTKIPKQLRRFVNVKDTFGQIYPRVRSRGMANVLQAMGLELIGRHHSGIDDTRNIARIVIELCKKGAVVEYEPYYS
mgnify:FL=1